MTKFKNEATAYGFISRFNHWFAAILVIGLLSVGLYFNDMPKGDEKLYWLKMHISTGGLFFIFLWFRVFWSVFTKSPNPVEQEKSLQLLTKFVHWLMILSVLIMAVTGPLLIWTRAADINVYSLFSIPGPFSEKMPELHEICEEIHEITAKVLLFSIVLHIIAALKHQFLDKDNTMSRMVKFLRN